MPNTGDLGSRERPISSLVEFIRAIEAIEEEPSATRVYRGHGDEAWSLLPAILRNKRNEVVSERDLIRHVISRYPHEFDSEISAFDRLTRLQHYNVPTRLLDVTSNPLIALYFSLEIIGSAIEKDGCVLLMQVPPDRSKFFDSDTVSCLANLSNLSLDEQNTLANSKARTIYDFNELKPSKRFVQFIREEKPYFLPEIQRNDLFRPLLVIPKLRNPRIIAQQGSFLIFGLDRTNGPKYSKNIKPTKIYISGDSKNKLADELRKIGFSRGTLFPEIDKVAPDLISMLGGSNVASDDNSDDDPFG